MVDGWKKKFKGSKERGGAFIYTHHLLSRAVVHNLYGVSYNGIKFPTVDEAKKYAISAVKEIYDG